MNRLRDSKGQGTVEYVLLLVIVVGIATGMLYQFNTAFANYARNYFGDYLACLLETGELPNLGVEQGVGCDADYEPFTLASGRPPLEPESSRNSSERNSSRSESSSSSTSEGERSSRETSSQTTRGRSGPSGGGPRVSRAFSSQSDSERGKAKKGATDEESGTRGEGYLGYGDYGKKRKKIKAKGVIGSLVDEEKEKKKKKTIQNVSFQEEDGRKKRIPVKKAKRKVAAEEEDEFTLGDFLRYLIIAAIIIAIVIFIGGQALQLGKEWD